MAAPTTEAPATAADASKAASALRMGTRRSPLALIQTNITKKALKEAWPSLEYDIHEIATNLGDTDKTTALYEMKGKSVWTHDLEKALGENKLDIIVHSLKDVPTQLPTGMTIGAILPREDPRDAVIIHPKFAGQHKSLATLPEGSVVGTSSIRRSAQLKLRYKHLKFANLRGNVGTRLAKLDAEDSEYAAIILAAAGMKRMGLGDRISCFLSSKPDEGNILHAVGQGAIGVEIREDDTKSAQILEKIQCPRTTKACLAERSLMRKLEGGCSVPIGVETSWQPIKQGVTTGVQPARDYDHSGAPLESTPEFTDNLTLKAIVVATEGDEFVDALVTKQIRTNAEAEKFGIEVAEFLVSKGAGKILEKMTLNRKIIESQD